MQKNKGILVVSFGTSYEDTRKKTIGGIENRIAEIFPEFKVYRAFTSQFVRRKLRKAGVHVYDVEEALEAMLQEGITGEIVVQPTHIINGIENDLMLESVKKYQDRFEKVSVGTPLLTSSEDYKELAHIIHNSYPAKEDEALVLMGHGSAHYSNSAYPAFEYTLKISGYEHIYVGTVEGFPSLEEVKQQLKKDKFTKVNLVPLMIVAGDHASNDMAGENDSWREELEQDGYQVRYTLMGLGELKEVQEMFIEHIHEARKEG